MPNRLLVPEIRELLQERDRTGLAEVLDDLHPKDAAEILAGLDPKEIVEVMSGIPLELERDIFGYLEPELQEATILGLERERMKVLLTSMPSDERAEFLEGLDPEVRARVFPLLTTATRNDVLQRGRFHDDQVGSFLSTDFCVLSPNLTTVQAIRELRRQAPRKETIYYSYVLDASGKLVGFVSLRDLICEPDHALVQDIMRTEMVTVRVDDDQERAAQLIRDYDLIALPVVDEKDRLMGIVTHDDAADIAEEEETEDVELMAGLTGDTEAEGYGDETVWSQIRRRAPVISFLAVFFLVTATVISKYEHALDGVLMGLLPMVMATGGMVGTQASSLIIRSITTGNLGPSAFRTVIWKEFRISAGMAAILSVIVFVEALVLGRKDDQVVAIAGVLALAMASHVMSAAMLGSLVPITVKALKRDPAMISVPAVTAVADFTGAVIYLTLVAALLPRALGAG